jgi:TolB-like protein/DNA-binding winged helix-turn-helix (wHTH) protein/cytochrome c-type biogenesis protein CcmH/NrfG
VGFRFLDFEIDLERHELRRAYSLVHIEPQVFDLLVHLVRNRDRVVGKDELLDTVWNGRIVSESTLSSRISAARRALADSGTDQSLIRTIHKRGFRFVGDVSIDAPVPVDDGVEIIPHAPDRLQDATRLVLAGESLSPVGNSSIAAHGPGSPNLDSGLQHGDKRPVDPDAVALHSLDTSISGGERPVFAEQPIPIRRNTIFVTTAIAVASLLMIAGIWLQTLSLQIRPAPEKEQSPKPGQIASLVTPVAAFLPSIVVVPFINLSSDSKEDYLADGVTDSLISDLGRALPGVSVVSRDTAFTYKGRRTDPRQIGRELEVRYLLSGSVALEGERARVNIQLVETKDGNQLWAERFDMERTSILQVQDEIVSRVSRAIGLKVVDIEARRSQRERPTSTELVDLVLRGKAALNMPSSPATMIAARELFEQALNAQRDDANALAGIATTLVFEFLNGYYETEDDERLQKAEPLLEQAIAIEPRNLMVLKGKAALRRAQGKFQDAITAAETIIEENPGEPWAYKEIGLSMMYLGRFEEALAWFGKADRIGPRDPGRWTWLDARGHDLILLGRDEDAIPALISALDANPRNFSSHSFLAASYALLGRSDDARASLDAYLRRHPETRVSTFRRLSPVPIALTSPRYRQQLERISEGLHRAGMPE